jgi:hypothetical protein
MKKQKKKEWRTEANDQPLAITATPAQPLHQRSAKETDAQAGKTSKKKLQKPTEIKETILFSTATFCVCNNFARLARCCSFDNMLDPQPQEYERMPKELQEAAL